MQKRDDGRVLAMKVMRKAHVVEKNQAEYMRTERDVLTRVEHPYIVTLQYSFQARCCALLTAPLRVQRRFCSTDNAAPAALLATCLSGPRTPPTQTATKLYLILDFINGGHLFFQLYRAGIFEEALARVYTAEIVLALSHLHSLGIAHRGASQPAVAVEGAVLTPAIRPLAAQT